MTVSYELIVEAENEQEIYKAFPFEISRMVSEAVEPDYLDVTSLKFIPDTWDEYCIPYSLEYRPHDITLSEYPEFQKLMNLQKPTE